MKCPNCGMNNYGDVNNCFNCGTLLVQTSAQPHQTLQQPQQLIQYPQQPLYQPQSPQYPPQTSMERQPQYPQYKQPKPIKKSKKPIIALIIIIIVIIASIGAYFFVLDIGDVEIKVTDKFYSYVGGGVVVLNITFENNKNFPIRFYTGDFSVRLKDGKEYTMSTIFEPWPDSVDSGKSVEFQIGFKRSEVGSIEDMDKLIYDHDEQWGTMHHIHKEVDL